METVQSEISPFQREFLWEISIPETQLLALAESVPEESYPWKPAEDARSFSEVMVHVAAGNLMLMYRAGIVAPEVGELYGGIEGDACTGDSRARWVAVIRRMQSLQHQVTAKSDVIDRLKRSFAAVRRTFTELTEDELETPREFFGEITTIRRLYLRMLAHSHEHMGQIIAYTRVMGYTVPWPDPLKELDRIAAASAQS